MKFIFPVITLFIASFSNAQETRHLHPAMDVTNYDFSISLSDSSDFINGIAIIDLTVLTIDTKLHFDLIAAKDHSKGMTASTVWVNGKEVAFSQSKEILEVPIGIHNTGDKLQIKIAYKGIPENGLIISKNKFGQKTFFADNWPNRARHWLPCNDHPSDKATVSFSVTAPSKYQVVSNGLLKETTTLPNNFHYTKWVESKPIPTKVMVIGVAQFAIENVGNVECIPVSSWVFPQEREKGFFDYAQAADILPFFIQKIGPYPFEKLANVQSKTMFGGMENAGCIFYYENSVNGSRKEEALIAHEIAHQWFGNSATEIHWSHLWLSEGFATFLTNNYLESKYGPDTLNHQLNKQKKEIFQFAKSNTASPIIDSMATDYFFLLNENSYQKGGWVLHMLRKELGDSAFFSGIKEYYNQYKFSNASSSDFQKVMEKSSGKNLNKFFYQWLRLPGYPEISFQWKYNSMGELEIQTNLYELNIPIRIETQNDHSIIKVFINSRKQIHKFKMKEPINIMVDPGNTLLGEWEIIRVK
jgi:aminopeptidase N